MDGKDFAKTVMNPMRQRIVQFLLLHGSGTVGEMAAELCDIPTPSLYRHVKVLADAGLLEVAEEKAVRGAHEKRYTLTPQPDSPDKKYVSTLIQSTLMTIGASFAAYLEDDDADMQRDMLSLTSCTLMLSDDELRELLKKITDVFSGYYNNKSEKGRKPRLMAFISAPGGGKDA